MQTKIFKKKKKKKAMLMFPTYFNLIDCKMPVHPCPSLSLRASSNSCPLSQWCHPTISSSVTPFSSCHQSLPVSGYFPVSHLFISGGQSIGASSSASVLQMHIQGWFPLGLTSLIYLLSKKLSRAFSSSNLKASALQNHTVMYSNDDELSKK